jgi:PAS domain S-box-containing protein
MRTSAPTQPLQTGPILNLQSEIRNQRMPCSAAGADESAAKHLFKLSRDVILSLDRVGKILCINHRGVELSGYSESELRGANIFELLLVPEDRELAREMLADLLKGETREYQVRWRTKEDGVVHFDGASVPRLSESGEFLSTLCTLRDVTERKSAEERLRKSEEKYRDLIEISPDAIYVIDADGICLLGNRASADLVGIPQDQLVGTPVTDTYLPEERHLFRERLEKLRTGTTIRFETKFVRKNGETVPVEVSVSAIHGGYFQAIVRDIKKFLRIPTLVGGRVKGFIGIRHGDRPPYRPEEIELAQALTHQAMLAIQLNEFAEQSRKAAVLEERNRLARDIHDTLAQGFTGVIVQLEALEDAIACCRRKEANQHLQRAGELARQSLNEARRSVHALRPQALQRGNFWEALKGIVRNTTAGTALHTTFNLRGKLRNLPQYWQENLLHIGQEALTNSLKYAHPRNFETQLIFNTKELRLELRDDGDGFKVNAQHDGFGLAGMRERVAQMGGNLTISSTRGKGTKIAVRLPYNLESVL